MSKVSNMIEYTGISKKLPKDATTFSQFNLENTLCIPELKPDMAQIVKVDMELSTGSYHIVKTPVGTSLEGQILTGNKLIVCGLLNLRIIYISTNDNQSVHSAHYEIPFCEFIVLPDSFAPSTPLAVESYVENMFVEQTSERCFFSCATVFLNVKFCARKQCNQEGSCDAGCGNIRQIGIADKLPVNPTYFKEIVISENLTIPDLKPDIERLTSATVEVDIVSTRLVATPSQTSLEGQNLSGCKLIVELRLRQVILYVADIPSQPVHAAHFESVLKSAFIVIPCEVDGQDVGELFDDGRIVVVPYIEDIGAIRKDNRNIFKCVTLLLNAEFK